ncbi:MAG: UDPGP type 1 family protein [Candidatus Woesearchaeota archaeon]|jgi:UDP-N-acetylglucosamine/UDP-N-acetylgalactosamine diphosphorylase
MHSRFSQEREKAERHGQDHIFKFWHELNDEQKEQILKHSEKIDYGFINKLYADCIKEKKIEKFSKLESPDVIYKYPHTKENETAKKIGEDAIKRNELAIFLVAGGQGSRLGYDGPKGCYPGTELTKKPLFRIFSERIKAAENKYEVVFDWFIMTSEENNKTTEKFFEENNYFKLNKDQIHFFIQGSLPSVSKEGKILMKSKHEIFFNPDGTGGIYYALHKSGMLEIMKNKGIKYLSYVQIDNPLSQVVDPTYLGIHILTQSELTPKVIPKRHAHESVGLVVKVDGKQQIIEYYLLSKEDAEKRDEKGELAFRCGNTAKFMMSVDFINKVRENKLIHFKGALKKITHIDEDGNLLLPDKPNGYKFESFSFDPMPYVKSVAFEVKREEEFAPIKNAEGEDSPEVSYEMQNYLYKDWLRHAKIPQEINDSVKIVEVSPLFANDKEEFALRIEKNRKKYEEELEKSENYYFE